MSANVNYVSDVTRQGTIADGVGPNPYEVMSYTPAFLDLDRKAAGGLWPINPFGPSNPLADAVETSTPVRTSRIIAGGTVAWTAWRIERQSLVFQATGGVDHAGLHDVVVAPAALQSQQQVQLPGTAITDNGHLTYTSFSGNVIHHYAGAWFDATTSFGYAGDRKENQNPITTYENLLSSANAGTTGSVVTSSYYDTSVLDRSFYGQEQILTLASRLALTAGVTAENSTLNGDMHRYHPYPHYSASYRIVQPVSAVDEIKVRAAYGLSGALPPVGARYAVLNAPALVGANGIQTTNSGPTVKPEAERETEVGLDVPMFNARAQLSATLYQKQVSDLVLLAGVEPAFGYTTTIINGGAFSDRGIELELEAAPLQLRNGFSWTTTTTFYRNSPMSSEMLFPIPPFSIGSVVPLFGADLLAVGRSATEIVDQNQVGANGLPIQRGDLSPGYVMSFSDALNFRGVRVYGLADWKPRWHSNRRTGSVLRYRSSARGRLRALGPAQSGDHGGSAAIR